MSTHLGTLSELLLLLEDTSVHIHLAHLCFAMKAFQPFSLAFHTLNRTIDW